MPVGKGHSFGAILRQYRLAAGLTQAMLAERAGVSERAVNDLERDPKRHPRLDTATLLAEALALPAAERAYLLGAAHRTLESVPPAPGAAEQRTTPQAATTALAGQLHAAALAPRTNLLAPQSGFVGREAELALVAERLANPACRLLTLLGLGGCGKTSLALRAAAAQAEPALMADQHPFMDGVFLVDLAAISAPMVGSAKSAAATMQRIATAIGRAVGLEFRGTDPVAHLAGWLSARAVLLVLDNMEHLLEGTELLTLLLERSQRVKVLVTTRERLRLPQEWVLEVGGLPLPSGPGDLEQAPASRLYLQLMQQAGLTAPPAAPERAAIVRLCELTQGLPLALALAARWTPSLSTAAIVRELETGVNLLTTHEQLVPERQRSIRAVLQWTWGWLSEVERAALRQLAVFQPGLTREAAWAVAKVEVTTLLALCERALLSRDPAAERYTMHELVRQYAAEQLADLPAEQAETGRLHAAYYADLVRGATPALRRTIEAQEAISADIANIRVAWDWAAERAEAGLLESLLWGLARWYELQGLPGQSVEALERAAERLRAALALATRPDPSAQRLLGFILVQEAFDLNMLAAHDRSRLLLEEARQLARDTASLLLEGRVAYGLGYQLGRQRDLRAAEQWLQQALVLARAAQEQSLEADTLSALGQAALDAGEYARAHGYFEQVLPLCRAQQDRYREMGVTYCLGMMAHARGDFNEAQRLLEDAQQLMGLLGCRYLSENYLLHELGQVYDEGWGRHVEAEACFAQDLRLTQEMGDRMREGLTLAALGRNALYQGDLERAGTLFKQALSLSREVGSRAGTAMALRGQSLLAHYRGSDERARLCAEEALTVARAAGMRREERLALRLLGHALLGLGELSAALMTHQQVEDLDEQLGFQHLHCETTTDLAGVAHAQGKAAQAVAYVAAILPELQHSTPAGLEEPVLAYLTCYRVLRACGDVRADEVLEAGHTLLWERAAQFVDEARRSAFFNNLPAHRELLAEWHGRDRKTPGGLAAGVADIPHLRMVRSESG
jgi:predicted ATPase/transcriptional regulator with XRE-family HTH domain